MWAILTSLASRVQINNVSFVLVLLVFTACGIFDPKDPIGHRLFLENGSYEQVGTIESGEITYLVEFTYYVTGEPCEVGGYGIDWGSGHIGSVDWYTKTLLEPGEKHNVSDSFDRSAEWVTPPAISMQGYLVGSSDTHAGLYAEYTLQAK